MRSARRLPTAPDRRRWVGFRVEVGQVGREDLGRTMRTVLTELAREAKSTLGDEALAEIWPDLLDTVGPDAVLGEVLARWCEADITPLILSGGRTA